MWIAFAAFWLVQVAIIIHGLEGIKKLESWSAPLLLGGRRAAAGLGGRGGAAASDTSSASRSRLQTVHLPFWQLFPAALTANVGYWATLSLNIPDFTRYARSQRSQALGPGAGPAGHDDRVRLHRRRRHQRDDRGLSAKRSGIRSS